MKITAITGPGGQLVAIVHAHLSEHDAAPRHTATPHATLHPQADQRFHELVAPSELRDQPHHELRSWVLHHGLPGAAKAG